MIKKLQGIHETVHFSNNSLMLMYNNDQYENYPLHWHTPVEIIVPIIGPYTVVCGHETFTLKETDILIIAPGTLHQLSAPPKGQRIIFQMDYSLINILKDLESVISLIAPAALITADNAPDIHGEIHKLMLDIYNQYLNTTTFFEASIYSDLIQLFVLIGKKYQYTKSIEKLDPPNAKQQAYAEKFLDVCNYINQHCTENLSLDQIAHYAGFSKYHFSRLFKQFTGISFYKYLNKKRIMRAEILLIDPKTTITEAALQSGFSSLSSFIRMFKILKNCTPTEFRHMHV